MRGSVDDRSLHLKSRTSAEPWRVTAVKVNDFVSSSASGDMGDRGREGCSATTETWRLQVDPRPVAVRTS